VRRRTSARFFPKKGCFVRLDVGEWAVALSSCEALGSLKVNLASKKSLGKTPSDFVFQAAFAHRLARYVNPASRNPTIF